MSVQIHLQCKRQLPDTQECYSKLILLPDKFSQKSARSLSASLTGTFCPPVNRLSQILRIVVRVSSFHKTMSENKIRWCCVDVSL